MKGKHLSEAVERRCGLESCFRGTVSNDEAANELGKGRRWAVTEQKTIHPSRSCRVEVLVGGRKMEDLGFPL